MGRSVGLVIVTRWVKKPVRRFRRMPLRWMSS